MPPPEHWIPFALATLAFAAMPGPAMLYMTAQTLGHGPRAGLKAALGIHVGCYIHIAAAALGLAAMLHHAPLAYACLKAAGAGYLVWLGAMMILGRTGGAEQPTASGAAVFRASIMVEVLNPKTALFFLTFLPQFADPAAAWPVWLQLLLLGLIVNAVLSAADIAAVVIAWLTLGRFATGLSGRLVPRACGSILMGLGVTLAHQA
ncbi:LysE family translocator [Phreatobacter stygius]|uniref:LysE family translocator n=1 Tax=Phreatobacter stygius TaxID=1940610 RepID=A0A4D7BNS3_9HYPH|nr:LysE family translocator [Phreatobacter stygius]QCI69262.1 LysE family translocator [Phreatobacter stygius]